MRFDIRFIAAIIFLCCSAASAQPFVQVGGASFKAKSFDINSVSVEAGYRIGNVEATVGVSDSTLSAGKEFSYTSKSISAIAYQSVQRPVTTFIGVQGATNHLDQFNWRYGVGVVAVFGPSISFTVSPAHNGQPSITGLSFKQRF